VVGAYPGEGSTNISHVIAVTAQYLPPSLELAGVTSAQLVTAQGTTYAVAVVSLRSKSARACLHTACALFEVKLRAPALDAPDSAGGVATFSAQTAAGEISWPFKYTAAGEPEVLGFSPKVNFREPLSDAKS
jgi:hypothetical protein